MTLNSIARPHQHHDMFRFVACPNCSAIIHPGAVQPRFKCHACGKELISNSASASFWAVVFGGIPLALACSIDSGWVPFIGLLIALAVGLAIWGAGLNIVAVRETDEV